MGTQAAQIDPLEREIAAAQLDDIALAKQGKSWAVLRDAVLAWHLDALASARAEAWIPGLTRSPDPMVEEALGRFYRHHLRLTIARLKAENLELRSKLIDAIACVRFYESGATDAGMRAHAMLDALEVCVGAADRRAH
jgi:hypothetical protein